MDDKIKQVKTMYEDALVRENVLYDTFRSTPNDQIILKETAEKHLQIQAAKVDTLKEVLEILLS